MRAAARPSPFTALGLPASPDLTGDEVRAAWRRVATATHPDRADGGDPARFAEAAAAYTVLRTKSGRTEAWADLAAQHPQRRWSAVARLRRAAARRRSEARRRSWPLVAQRRPAAATARWPRRVRLAGLRARIRRGRPLRLALRVTVAAAVGVAAALTAGTQPATPALIVGALTWLWLTARHDLAPPR